MQQPLVVPQPDTIGMPNKNAPDDVSTKHRTESAEPEEQEPEEQRSLRRGREPWFYGYLEKYAKILQILGYISAAGCVILSTILFIVVVSIGLGAMKIFLSFLGWVLCLVYVVAALLLWLVGVAAILLAVDAARNIRAMKKELYRRGGEVGG